MIDSIKETIEKDNTICNMCKHILKSIAKEAKEEKRVSICKVKDLLTIQTEFLTAFDEHIANDKLSEEQIRERIEILELLHEMTNSLFEDALNVLSKRLGKKESNRKDELNELTKDELSDLVKTLEKEKEQK